MLMNIPCVAAARQSAANLSNQRRSTETPLRCRERGALMTELMIGIGVLAMALFPLAYSFAQEAKFLRSCYHRAVAVEIVDSEMEVLLAGEWRSFKPGQQDYVPHALAATNLASG